MGEGWLISNPIHYHLGEVIWQMGEHEKATEVWEEALKARPESQLIKAVIERFRPE